MGIGSITSTTILGDRVIESSTVNTELYSLNQQQEEKTVQEMPNVKHQKMQRPKQPKLNPVVPARGSTKAAAEEIHKANAADLKKKNIR